MVLTIGVSALIITLLGAGIAVRLSRNERLPGWIRDGFVGMIYLPILTGVLVVGIGYVAYEGYQLMYRDALLLTMDTLYGALLTVVLVLGIRWSPAKRIIFGSSTPSMPQAAVIPIPVADAAHSSDTFRPAA